ncbi:hypothetical protein QYE76_029273 [Lolium multiflorum]|uniref:Reverse transcriptase domain-containing protein n=1 Tax=Lolium multiflorum TaxID=4521 RepID=A0AAD8VI20_LOLMU|nr:hypothetical protein QYE76_029273 [Lolium multiflorum]
MAHRSTYEDRQQLKKKYDEVKTILEADLIGSFHEPVRMASVERVLTGARRVDLSVRRRTPSLRQEISYMVTHSLHRHSESLVNTLECVAFRMIQEIMRHQYSLPGPALGTYQGEVPLQSRPPLPFAFAAPEVPKSPAYAIDMVEDMHPGRCQPRHSFNINMVELGHRPSKGRDEGSCSHSEDKEEAVPRDRPRHCQKILVMIKMKADSSDRPVLSTCSPSMWRRPHRDARLDRSIIEHRLPLKKGFRPFQQRARQMRAKFWKKSRKRSRRCWPPGSSGHAGMLRVDLQYRSVEKKDGRWRVAIDFRDLNRATSKDEYPMPVAETLINAAAGHKVLSFMDGNAGYNQIFMAPEDIHKTAFRVPGAWLV